MLRLPVAPRKQARTESADYWEEREARIQEIIARVKHHHEEAARHLSAAKKLEAQLEAEPNRRRRAKGERSRS